MKRELLFNPEFHPDFCKAKCWIESSRPEHWEFFKAAVYHTIAQIVLTPELFGIMFGSSRRARVKKFPYGMILSPARRPDSHYRPPS